MRKRRLTQMGLIVALASGLLIIGPPGVRSSAAQTLPTGFQESIVFSGLTEPTAIAFALDGRVFVAEKSGLIKVFDSLADTTPTVFADLRVKVHNFWDRGLLGLALPPTFPTNPYVYVLYAHDAAIGGTAPRWGPGDGTSDPCPNPPGATTDGCVVSGRLSRLQAAGNVMTGGEQVLIEAWCQQYPSHSIGGLAFGSDGALYVSGGDGASFGFVDYGQDGSPLNPCGDPPVGVGGVQAPPNAEGGALRSQSVRRAAGEPVLLNGAILRVDPATGAALTDNPLFGNSDANARRIIAHGLRNPFRFTTRPGTSEIWVGDVGWNDWEEINRIPNPTAAVSNFGWPCYEGGGRQFGYDGADLSICENLYSQPAVVIPPFYSYNHSDQVVLGETCSVGSSSISGMAFYGSGAYPAAYNGALFFADYSRNCIWAMFQDTGGVVAAYGLDEGTGNTVGDASGNNHLGSIVGATWTTSGKYGKTLSFNGTSNYMSVANPGLPTGDYTWSAWVNPTQTSGFRALMVARGLDLSPGGLEFDIENGKLIVWSNGALRLTSSATVPAGVWTHVAVTRSGSTIRLYINGTQDANTGTDGVAHNFGTCPLLIGVDNDSGCTGALNGYFLGLIDEVRVYSRALTVAEIQADMSTPVSQGSQTAAPLPDPTKRITFVANAAGPVDLKIGPGGDLFYADFNGGTIRRIQYGTANRPPTAVAQAAPASGAAPLTVTFNGTGSSDPDGDAITYSWDLNGDGVFGDSTSVNPTFTYTSPGLYNAKLRVTDSRGASSIATVAITVGTPPTATIDTPLATLTWKVGDVIAFSGHATDLEDGTLPATRLSWSVILHHCPSNCHTHPLQSFAGVANGSFPAPDHDYPSHLEIQLTATDSTGLTDTKSVLLNPQTVVLSFQSNPSGLQLAVGSTSAATPFTRTVILGSSNSLSATSPQTLVATIYAFGSWSDGGAQSHNITASAAATYTATYTATGALGLVAAYGMNEGTGNSVGDASGNNHLGSIVGATWTTSGKYGKALSFNGTSNYVSVASPGLPTGNYTWSAWVNPTQTSGFLAIMVARGLGVSPGGLEFDIENGKLIVWSNGALRLTSAGTIPAGVWTHVALTRSGSTLRAYINGTQDANTGTDGVAHSFSTCPLLIGVDNDTGCTGALNGYFPGRIDEVRVYNRALTITEIQTDMNTPISP